MPWAEFCALIEPFPKTSPRRSAAVRMMRTMRSNVHIEGPDACGEPFSNAELDRPLHTRLMLMSDSFKQIRRDVNQLNELLRVEHMAHQVCAHFDAGQNQAVPLGI